MNLPAAKPQSPDPHADHLPPQPGDRENDDVDGDVDVGDVGDVDVGVDGDDDEKELRVLTHFLPQPTNILLYLRHIARILSNLMFSLSIPGQTIHTAPSAAGVENL